MSQPEAFSRILIDKALEFSGWELLKPKQIQFELHTGNGRADYLLKDSLGRVLCVLEAKREGLDPYDAKEQARGYAEKLNAPFIILSNGREHWFWNYERADQRAAYRIKRLPSREDLERVRLKNLQPPRPLGSEVVTPEYLRQLKHDLTLRCYQIRTMDELARLFDTQGLRKFLLEMATGTGKTLLCVALIRRFLMSRNAERVLFIVDRIELAKQTIEDFAIVLPEFKPVIYKTARRTGELLGSSVVIATIQSLMTDRRYRDEFTPTRNRLTCEAFLKEAQKDPAGAIGKSIVFSVNQTHATNLTKIFNELHPGIALTITSRIPDALAKWRNRDEGPNSYGVPIEKIRENDWSLAAGRYKPVTAEPVHYDNPRRIVAEVLALEARITEKLTRLQGMVQ